MTRTEQIITIAMCVLGTVLTRFLPVCRIQFETPHTAVYSVFKKGAAKRGFAMLVVYCLRNVSFLQGSHGLPKLIAIGVTVGLHLWKRQMLLSIAGGTICYMLLVQFVF